MLLNSDRHPIFDINRPYFKTDASCLNPNDLRY